MFFHRPMHAHVHIYLPNNRLPRIRVKETNIPLPNLQMKPFHGKQDCELQVLLLLILACICTYMRATSSTAADTGMYMYIYG